jgi:hypothetical protein
VLHLPVCLASRCTPTRQLHHRFVCLQVHFAEPVLVTGVSLVTADPPADGPKTLYRAWARDLRTPAAARLLPLIGTVSAPCEAAAVLQVRCCRCCNSSSRISFVQLACMQGLVHSGRDVNTAAPQSGFFVMALGSTAGVPSGWAGPADPPSRIC